MRRLAILLVGLFVLGMVGTQLIIAPMIARKLKATVAAHLDASLEFGALTYRPPFTVHLYNVQFTAHPGQSGGTELLSARQIELSLAKLPLGHGPLIIEKLGVRGVALHVVRGSDGGYVGLDLARHGDESRASPAAMKLSDVLRLRHFSLTDGMLIYLDQMDPGAAPMEWKGIDSDIALTPQSVSLYGFQLDATDRPIADAAVDGTLDVDSLALQIKKFTASVQAIGSQQASAADPLPPPLRSFLDRYSVKGKVDLAAAASVPLRDPQSASFTADVGVQGGRATLPDGGERLDDLALSAHLERNTGHANDRQIRISLRQFRAVSGGAILHINSSAVVLDPWTGKWSVDGTFGSLDAPLANRGPWGMTGHADFHVDVAHDPSSNQTACVGAANLIGINLAPQGLAAPVEGLTGAIQFSGNDASDRQVIFHGLTASYGGDRLALDRAVVLLGLLPERIQVNDIQSHVDLVQDAPLYPGDLGGVLHALQPSGRFVITGVAAMQHVVRDDGPGYSPEWELSISTEDGNLALLDERLRVSEMKGQMIATRHAISISSLSAKLLGGSMDLACTARFVEPIAYEGQFNEHDASVEQFARTFKLKSPDGTEPSGVANLGFKFFSQTPTPTTTPATISVATTEDASDVDHWLSLLGGEGKLQIDNGNLWALPVLQSLSAHTRSAREALTAGEAAAVFNIAHRTVYLKHVAIYSPALGLQGTGTETFDGNIDLDIIAAPLGDWKKKLAETDIPILSHVLASAAGSIEKLVGSATSELLYHFRVTGTRDNPQVQTVPAPFITDSAASLFARMMHHDDNSKLIDAVGDK
jgi:hypothetical protein